MPVNKMFNLFRSILSESMLLYKWTTLLLLLYPIKISRANLPECEFPDEWLGEWNLEGERISLNITKETFGTKGLCLKHDDDMGIYILSQRNNKCYHCLSYENPHPSILQIREGPCQQLEEGEDDTTIVVSEFCQEFSQSGSPLLTMVSLSAPAIDCPFTGEFDYTYKKNTNTGQQPCRHPVSKVDRCMDSTQIAFRFASCPAEQSDNRDTSISQIALESIETGIQTLTCKGMWTGPAEKQFQPFEELIQNDQFVSDDYSTVEDDVYNNNNEDQSSVVVTNVNYLVGILDEPYLSRINDKVRCFIYQETSNGGFRLAQSKDASCKGLVNVRKDGYRTMHLTPVKETTADASLLECTFPQWATDIGTLHSFALTSQYTFSEDGTTMKMSNYSHLSGEGVPQSISVCQKIVEELYSSTAMVRMVVKVTAQCITQYKCLDIWGRTPDIIEMQEGIPVYVDDATEENILDVCRNNMNEDKSSFTTLINAEVPNRPCINGGNYNVTELSLKGKSDLCSKNGFNQISIYCQEPELVQFLRDCSEELSESGKSLGLENRNNNMNNIAAESRGPWYIVSEFFCLGGWEEFVPSLTIESNYEYYSGYSNPFEDYMDFPIANLTIGYQIARPKSTDAKAPKRVCMIYTNLNDTYFWTVDPRSCPRKIKPGVAGIFKFNTTKIETCGTSRLSNPYMAFSWLSLIILHFICYYE